MALGVRLEPELEDRLERLAQRMGCSRSDCVRAALRSYLLQFDDFAVAKEQSLRVHGAEAEAHWSEELPDWADWTA